MGKNKQDIDVIEDFDDEMNDPWDMNFNKKKEDSKL